jgi:hypothetical protein
MTAPLGFRRSWLHWFSCPRCGFSTLFPRTGGQAGADGKSIRVLFWCPSCLGFCKLKRPWLVLATAFGTGIPAFAAIFWLLLKAGSLPWTVFWIGCVLVVMQAVSLAVEGLIYEYVAA